MAAAALRRSCPRSCAGGAALGVALLAAACSGKPRPEDTRRGAPARDAAPVSLDAAVEADAGPGAARADAARAAGPGAGGRGAAGADAGAGTAGDLAVRVEWPAVPVLARTSPGRTPCGAPRAAQVSPTTTWGVPDALVVIDGAARPLEDVQVSLAACALTPRLAVGNALVIASAMAAPARVAVRARGTLAAPVIGAPVPVQLPIAGHAVRVALDAAALYAVETADPAPELAYVAALPDGFVTDASGQVVARGLAAGTHAVTVWLPPRAGQPARRGRGAATVVAGELAELTIKLEP